MTVRAVKLSEKNVKQLDSLVKAGKFKSPDAAVSAGLKLLSAKVRPSKAREQTLDEALRIGEESIARGDVVTLKTPKEIHSFFNKLTERALRKAKR
jgi:Arc/MetJ-type ribon-helix-helix transcriptional regulator